MSSAHTSPKVHASSLGFFGVLNAALTTDEANTVVWQAVDVASTKADFDKYDAIFVGITAPTSVSANKAYGALHLINLMFDSPKLHLVVDSPQLWQIEQSLASVTRNPASLFKPFYSKRSGYELAKLDPQTYVDVCNKLLTGDWPTTIYPGLPWKSSTSVLDNLPKGASNHLVALNFDSLYISDDVSYSFDRDEVWAVDTIDTEWAQKAIHSVSNDIELVRQSKQETDRDALNRIQNSAGLFVSPQKRKGGTWWTYRYIQALNSETPVATEWRDSGAIGPEWAVLPSQLEDMAPIQRALLASHQREAYVKNIPSKEEAINSLNYLLTHIGGQNARSKF